MATILLLLRILHAPFSSALGGHARDRAICSLVIAQQRNAEFQSRFLPSLADLQVNFHGVTVCLNESFLPNRKGQLRNFSGRPPSFFFEFQTNSKKGKRNPCYPPAIGSGIFVDPFETQYHVLGADEKTRAILVVAIFFIGISVISRFSVFMLRKLGVWGIRGTPVVKTIAQEENQRLALQDY
jgi:hypothetical protein